MNTNIFNTNVSTTVHLFSTTKLLSSEILLLIFGFGSNNNSIINPLFIYLVIDIS